MALVWVLRIMATAVVIGAMVILWTRGRPPRIAGKVSAEIIARLSNSTEVIIGTLRCPVERRVLLARSAEILRAIEVALTSVDAE